MTSPALTNSTRVRAYFSDEDIRARQRANMRLLLSAVMALHLCLNRDADRRGTFFKEAKGIIAQIEHQHTAIADLAMDLFGDVDMGPWMQDAARRINETFRGTGVQLGVTGPDGEFLDTDPEEGFDQFDGGYVGGGVEGLVEKFEAAFGEDQTKKGGN